MRLAAFLLLATAAFPQRHVTQGRAQTITENLYKCPQTVNNHRIAAVEYTDEEVGVTNLPAYTKFPNHFQGARWIWSANLVFDNLVLIRKTVP